MITKCPNCHEEIELVGDKCPKCGALVVSDIASTRVEGSNSKQDDTPHTTKRIEDPLFRRLCKISHIISLVYVILYGISAVTLLISTISVSISFVFNFNQVINVEIDGEALSLSLILIAYSCAFVIILAAFIASLIVFLKRRQLINNGRKVLAGILTIIFINQVAGILTLVLPAKRYIDIVQ